MITFLPGGNQPGNWRAQAITRKLAENTDTGS